MKMLSAGGNRNIFGKLTFLPNLTQQSLLKRLLLCIVVKASRPVTYKVFYCPICGRIPCKFMPVVPNDDSLFHPLLLVEVPFYRRCLHLFPPAVADMGNFLLKAFFCLKKYTESSLIIFCIKIYTEFSLIIFCLKNYTASCLITASDASPIV